MARLMMQRRALLAASGAAVLAPRGAFAQAWPARPLRLIAPFAPGGGSDFTSRLIAEKLTARLGQTMIVENKPGAGGNLGAEAAIKSPPDGYTYLTISGSYTINAILHKPSFDSLNDIVAIGQFTDEPIVLTVNPAVPAKTLAELVALCKREPGKLTYGSSGPGGLLHLGTELFLDAAGIKATHVPYRGTALALADLLAGNLQMLSGGTTTMLPYIKSGKLRALAMSSRKRLAAAPDIPSYGEQGYPALDFNLWHGMIGPKGIPAEIVARLNAELDAVLKSPDVSSRLAEDGVIAVGGTSDAFMATIRAEVARWQDFIQRTGLKLE
ncbi:MAG: tripartite tricarboxylate transporter substrate binding protein [Reyranella sp.]|uniref:Bug family tripartite tricarboxylate transporter substrate binding protein n=1 Tax=Reyranella sp. TaxID=1929291 RepID=UPI0025F0C479|nr:tripartite tricarboxylate transporter substrate binding protein [Reyranella sp.]MBR2813874.1 tripartite tricarboxylate transporter substrate binding protein [Reyranella sp.]